ncbi:hypothetical protein ACKKBG_A35795 [Auxenochlorella protothecoides x Auxenochlorella symbiontica]|uniref:Uncharacterized protein n=1 Tax=Auxenochlorella protothecoides TaxID=3075 RepID=A0A3M7KX85_AUXPR|nr:hypothetical protein APUTEX25_001503 [Auxenochlorella protothecoides]|eukprot:RMZ54345.1 hypothetical protein APUTEX25_001503 [Auxenochlorella protothecoides]
MGVAEDELFNVKPLAAEHRRRTPNYAMLSPIVWAPIMYTMRHVLKGRVAPKTQHALFFGATCFGLLHAGIVMTSDSSV